MTTSLRRAVTAIVLAVSAATFVPSRAVAADDAIDPASSAYVDSVKAALGRHTHFPTGREVSLEQPTGRSEVAFTLSRRGKVSGIRTSKSSNSQPLDEMARALVGRARYPAFPATAWPGSPAHDFLVTYNFTRSPKGTVTVGEPVEVAAP